jgi:hypothetical protein
MMRFKPHPDLEVGSTAQPVVPTHYYLLAAFSWPAFSPYCTWPCPPRARASDNVQQGTHTDHRMWVFGPLLARVRRDGRRWPLHDLSGPLAYLLASPGWSNSLGCRSCSIQILDDGINHCLVPRRFVMACAGGMSNRLSQETRVVPATSCRQCQPISREHFPWLVEVASALPKGPASFSRMRPKRS